jgi:hypothetical protein
MHVMQIMFIHGLLYKYSTANQIIKFNQLRNFLVPVYLTVQCTAELYSAIISWQAHHSYVVPSHVQTINYFFGFSGSATILVIVFQMSLFLEKCI